MNTSYAFDAYRAHDLTIAMRTSSGDTIELDFSNHQAASFSHSQNGNSSSTSMSFASIQSFHFKIDSNGIDAQDQKEIDAFMKVAQPFIDDFLQELQESAPKSPVTQLAHKIASIFEPSQERDENHKNHVKTNIVKMFDDSLNKLKAPQNAQKLDKLDTEDLMEKILEDTKKLLEKTLEEFENFGKTLYA